MSKEQQPSPQTNPPEFFTRLEEKYLLPVAHLQDFQKTLDQCSVNQSFLKTEAYTVESTYYDTPQLDSYTKHFDQANLRYKLRERRYVTSEKNEENSPSFLELKEKFNGVCTKSRIKISKQERRALRSSLALNMSPELITLNPKNSIEELKTFIEKINGLTIGASFSPQCKIQYKRNAVECALFRATYDTQLEYNSLRSNYSSLESIKEKQLWISAMEMKSLFNTPTHLIVEIKHKGLLPKEITNFFASLKINEQSFSKYIYCMTSILASTPLSSASKKKQSKDILQSWNSLREVAL